MASNKLTFGAPFNAPVKQTLLPVLIEPSGMCYGFITIPTTTFNGDETQFTVAEGPIPVKTIQMPQKIDDRSGMGVKEFMAAVFPAAQEGLRPWLGYSSMIDTNSTGYYTWWAQPTITWQHRIGLGTLIGSLIFGMATYAGSEGAAPVPPSPVPATMTWTCDLPFESLMQECAFFDFQWINTFNDSLSVDARGAIEPQSIEVLATPPQFKASVISGYGGQPYPGGAIIYDTIRILKVQDVSSGTYTFNFQVKDTHGNAVPVTLTLNVVTN